MVRNLNRAANQVDIAVVREQVAALLVLFLLHSQRKRNGPIRDHIAVE